MVIVEVVGDLFQESLAKGNAVIVPDIKNSRISS